MPFIKNRLARVTSYKNNCALNCLVHVLLRNIKLNNIPPSSLEALRKALNKHYGINLNFEQFKNAININNPIHREIVLGPVLREMLLDANVVGPLVAERNKPKDFLDDSDMSLLANFFGIRVQSYGSFKAHARGILWQRNRVVAPTEEEIEAESLRLKQDSPQEQERDVLDQHGQGQEAIQYDEQDVRIESVRKNTILVGDIPVLKLWNENDNHFEYEETDEQTARGHNAAYGGPHNHSDKKGFYSDHRAPDIIKNMKKRVREVASSANPDIDFSAILEECEGGKSQNNNSRADQDNPFSTMFGNGVFSSLGQKIFQIFAAPFTNAAGQPDFGFKASEGWKGLFEGLVHFALKIFQILKGMVNIAPDIAEAFNTSSQSGGDPFGLGQRFSNMSNDFASASNHAEQPAPSSRPVTSQFNKAKASAKPFNSVNVHTKSAPVSSDDEGIEDDISPSQVNGRKSSSAK